MPDKIQKLRFDDPKKTSHKRRKGYRLITVDGVVFNWRYHDGHLLVIIGPDDKRRTFDLSHLSEPVEPCGCGCGSDEDWDLYYRYDDYSYRAPITPRDVVGYARQMI